MNAGWQEWSAFSNNLLVSSGGLINPVAELDRYWGDTWYAGIAFGHQLTPGHGYGVGISYDESPVEDADRTFDLPVDETYKLSAAYLWTGKKNLDFAVGTTLMSVGDTATDQTAKGVRVVGNFDAISILFLGATQYIFP